MSDTFDPYLKWLGIPPKDRPIDHYRLLGIQRFESDLDAIANAADQRMAHLKTLGGGRHGGDAQKILNELAAARVCLLSAERKEKYDTALRAWMEKNPSAGQSAVAAAAAMEENAFLNQIVGTPAAPRSGVPPLPPFTRKKSVWPVVGALVACLAAVGILLTILVATRPETDDLETAFNGDPSAVKQDATPPSEKKPSVAPKDPSVKPTPDPAKEKPLPDPASKVEPPVVPIEATPIPDPRLEPKVVVPDPMPAKPVTERPTPWGTASERPLPNVEPKPTGPFFGPAKPVEPAAPPAPKKLAEPDADAMEKAVQEVADVYGDRLSKSKTAQEKRALATELEQAAQGTRDNPAAKFILFQRAGTKAAEAGDLALAFHMIDEIGNAFEANVLPLKADALMAYFDIMKAAKGPVKPQLSEDLMEYSRHLAEAAQNAGDLETATRGLNLALQGARRLKNMRAQTEIKNQLREVGRLQERQRSVQEAEEVLAKTPDDPQANAAVGNWYCLSLGDWNKGLDYLAKGTNAELAELAKQDLAKPDDSAKQLELGDAWWTESEKHTGVEATRLQTRAAHWYRLAMPSVSGLVKVKIQKRLEGLKLVDRHFALRFDGRTSYVVLPAAVYTGAVPITVEVIAKPNRGQPGMPTSYGIETLVSNGYNKGLWLGLNYSQWSFTVHYNYRSSPLSTVSSTYSSAQRVYSEIPFRGGDAWLHVAGVFDGRQMRLYVDGQLQSAPQAIDGVHAPSPQPFVIGATPPETTTNTVPRYFFNGLIRSVRISKSAMYTQNFKPPTELSSEANTVLLTRFTEGQGDQIKDSKGKVIGQITGAEWVELKEGRGAGK